jgi:hypothetical protein
MILRMENRRIAQMSGQRKSERLQLRGKREEAVDGIRRERMETGVKRMCYKLEETDVLPIVQKERRSKEEEYLEEYFYPFQL